MPLTAPARRPVNEKSEERNAYWSVARSGSQTARKNPRNAAVPSPPANESIMDAAYRAGQGSSHRATAA
jgi:hypothetical protein